MEGIGLAKALHDEHLHGQAPQLHLTACRYTCEHMKALVARTWPWRWSTIHTAMSAVIYGEHSLQGKVATGDCFGQYRGLRRGVLRVAHAGMAPYVGVAALSSASSLMLCYGEFILGLCMCGGAFACAAFGVWWLL